MAWASVRRVWPPCHSRPSGLPVLSVRGESSEDLYPLPTTGLSVSAVNVSDLPWRTTVLPHPGLPHLSPTPAGTPSVTTLDVRSGAGVGLSQGPPRGTGQVLASSRRRSREDATLVLQTSTAPPGPLPSHSSRTTRAGRGVPWPRRRGHPSVPSQGVPAPLGGLTSRNDPRSGSLCTGVV